MAEEETTQPVSADFVRPKADSVVPTAEGSGPLRQSENAAEGEPRQRREASEAKPVSDNTTPPSDTSSENPPAQEPIRSDSGQEPASVTPPEEAVDSSQAKTETPEPQTKTKILEPVQAPEPPDSTGSPQETAQVGLDEPLASEPATKPEQEISEVEPSEAKYQTPTQTKLIPSIAIQTSRNSIRELKVGAEIAIQNRKRKKLDHIMTLFAKRTNITNDEVEKLLHVSDATATRYLSVLEKEGKIKQTGKTGKGVSYLKL